MIRPCRKTAVSACNHQKIGPALTIPPNASCAPPASSCPSFWADEKYIGPAAIVQAHRFIFDSRDQAHNERLEVAGDTMGVWRCRTVFNCTNACPRDIEVTRAIAEVKMALTSGEI